MRTQYTNKTTRAYFDNFDQLVAVAVNPTWEHDIEAHIDGMTQYYCLDGIWEPQNDTRIVSTAVLHELAGVAPKSV